MKQSSEILKSAYLRKKGVNKGFTLRFVAQKMDASIAFISQVFSGKRFIPLAKVDLLCDLLDLDTERREIIFRAAVRGRSRLARPDLLTGLDEEPKPPAGVSWVYQNSKYFWVLEKPIYLAILNCTLVRGYDGTPEFLARKLNITLTEAVQAFQRLKDSPFLTEENGKLVKSSRFNDFNSEASKDLIRKFHRGLLSRAAWALDRQQDPEANDARLITSCVLTVPAARLASSKEKIRKFLSEMAADLAAETGDEVYQLAVQFVPFTRPLD